MFKFILNILIMLSFSAILYLIARALPRIDDREAGVPSLKTHWTAVYLERFDNRFKYYLEKTLRRSGIIVLRLDNVINKKLSKLKKEKETETETAVFIAEVESDTNKEGEEEA